MPQHILSEHMPLATANGFIPCSTEYRDALESRNAIHRPSAEHYMPDHLPRAERERWFEFNGQMDRLQWEGGHVGATVFFDPPGDVPHGWLILKKRDKAADRPVSGEADGQWRADSYFPFRYVTQTGDNGENDLGLGYAFASVKAAREGFAEWATRREKLPDTQFLLLACFQVDEGSL
jgi:hypothetical protein